MTTAQEFGLYPDADDLTRRAEARHAAAHGQYVGIIMFPRHPGRIDIMAERRANPLDFIGGNGNADARAAEHDAPIRCPAGDIPAYFFRYIGIIHRIRGKGSHIPDFNILEFR